MEATDTTQSETSIPVAEAFNEPSGADLTPQPKVAETFDPEKIDPKVKEHFEKTYSERYKDYDESKKAATQLNSIRNDPAFQEWLRTRNAPPAPVKAKEFELTDDQFTAALTDKNQFAKLVQEAAKHLVDQQIGPKLAQTDYHFKLEAKKTELSGAMQKYPDFKELDAKGLIAPLIEKYPSLSFEEAYKLAKYDTFKDEVAKAARGQVGERRNSSIEKPNNVPGARRNVVKVADRLEAMERAADDFRAGREPAEYEYD